MSGCVSTSSIRPRLSGSAHCRSSRNSASGRPLSANALKNWRSTSRNLRSASVERQVGDRRSVHQCRELGDQVDHEPSIDPEGLTQASPPPRDDLCAFGRELSEPATKGLSDGGVGNAAPVLIELAREEEPALADDGAIQLLDQRRLADAGVSAHQHERRPALVGDAVERGEQRLDLALSSVEPVRDPELRGRVPLAEREGLDAAPAVSMSRHRRRSCAPRARSRIGPRAPSRAASRPRRRRLPGVPGRDLPQRPSAPWRGERAASRARHRLRAATVPTRSW